MPIPNPTANQSKDEFVSQCMHALRDEKRPQDQKLAICFSTWKKSKQRKKASGSTELPKWEEQVVKDENGDCIIL